VTTSRRAAVLGTGLIGGSIGLALRERGWHVVGHDRDEDRARRALELGALDMIADGDGPDVDITFVATPVGAVVDAARDALQRTSGLVTDVGSVKRAITEAVAGDRFVGGHPMAGSEQEGVDGARADLFEGAVWVLTPVRGTDDDAYLRVRSVVASLGAEVVAVPPDQHDALVAVVSHVPHLTAATLMQLAGGRAEDSRAVLRLAAGGFRDMTRVAAGHPGIWPDICAENREAIVEVLDQFIDELGEVRHVVAAGDRAGLLARLDGARDARLNLPARLVSPDDLAELRVPVPDEPGTLATVTTLASEHGVNIVDIEIAHSGEGDRGVLIMVVATDEAERFHEALLGRSYTSSWRALR
jgi:prephenate dehydrogenase